MNEQKIKHCDLRHLLHIISNQLIMALKIQAFFKKASAPAKSAPAPKKGAKVAPKKASTGGSKTTGGWLGSDSKNVALDKW
jgi:hypothetical protein